MSTRKGLIRSNNRKGVRSGKVEAAKADGPGRVLLRGAYVMSHEGDLRRRIEHAAGHERARSTQPERCVVSVERAGDGLEVVTPSQELAHRIVRELKKAFHGEASYAWSDTDGSLFAVWKRDA